MVLWEEESVGTVQLRDVYQGVGSTDTAASASTINRVTHSHLAMPLGQGWDGGGGGRGVMRNDSCQTSHHFILSF